MQAGDRRRVLGALGASLALHAGALLLLRPGAGLPPAPRRPIEIALLERPRAPTATPVSPAPGAPAALRAPARTAGGAHGPGRPRGRGEPEGPAPATGSADPHPPLPGPAVEPGGEGWREAEGLGHGAPTQVRPERATGGGLPVGEPSGRGVHRATSEGAEGGAATEAGSPAPGSPPARAAMVKARLDGYLREVLAADRASAFPDAYWARLGRQLEDGMSVGWSLLARGSPDDAVVSGSRAGQALEAWERAAAAFGRTGQVPRGEGRARAEDAAHERRPPAERSLFVTEVVTEVELEQAADGAIVGWRVVQPSSNPAHDELVLARVAAMAEEAGRHGSLGPAPAQGRRTTWSVRTRFEMIPPMPVVGCGFDATFRPTGCFYPLKRMVKTRVRLERVWSE